jgi:hypothetical protein
MRRPEKRRLTAALHKGRENEESLGRMAGDLLNVSECGRGDGVGSSRNSA